MWLENYKSDIRVCQTGRPPHTLYLKVRMWMNIRFNSLNRMRDQIFNLNSWSGPEGYLKVLDFSIFKSLLIPYPKNFTTRPSSWVVIILPFLSNHSNFQKVGTKSCNCSKVYLSVLWHSWAPFNVEGNQSGESYRQFNSIWMYYPYPLPSFC